MKDIDRKVADIAAAQFGVFSRRQAARAGLSDEPMTRRVMTGQWDRVLPGVYRLAGVPATAYQRALAAVLWAGPACSNAASHGALG